MDERTVAVGVVLYGEGSVLLVRHTAKARFREGVYGFPAGGVDGDESFKEAAVRELKEETGLDSSADDLYELPVKKSTLDRKDGNEDFVFYPFLCRKYSGELEASDKNVPEFVELERLDDIPLVHSDVRDIAREFYGRFLTA